MNEVLYLGLTHRSTRRHHTKFSRRGNLAPGIFALQSQKDEVSIMGIVYHFHNFPGDVRTVKLGRKRWRFISHISGEVRYAYRILVGNRMRGEGGRLDHFRVNTK